MTHDFQQCGILTSVDSDEPVQPPLKLRNSKWCSVSSLTLIKYPSDKQRLWSDCVYAQADLRLCWSHIPHCWKSHVAAKLWWCKTVYMQDDNYVCKSWLNDIYGVSVDFFKTRNCACETSIYYPHTLCLFGLLFYIPVNSYGHVNLTTL